jgi:hypothetical protein
MLLQPRTLFLSIILVMPTETLQLRGTHPPIAVMVTLTNLMWVQMVLAKTLYMPFAP